MDAMRLSLAALWLCACAADLDGSLDPIDAELEPTSWAEDSREARAALELVNQADLTEMIEEIGLHPIAAEAVAAFKLGPDGRPVTIDDRSFHSLSELDAVDHVGPIAIELLVVRAVEQDYGVELEEDIVAASCWDYSDPELMFLKRINRARARRDIPRLERDRHLSRVARRWSKRMRKADDLKHNPNLADQVTNWSSLAENVGVHPGASGLTWQEQVNALHNAFMSSSSHRANILQQGADYHGVGVVFDSSGALWVTEIFSSGGNPGTTLSMPDC